ncbi:protein root UVB sensitive 5 [Citrus clementina]|uniref:protein root UVB sensitive 5 n=1 Tax=Citrus clementina TaxID=85681 RepID=UPI000CED4082|nr:protein root UVB sensitive 5 [Citrus x clementina]
MSCALQLTVPTRAIESSRKKAGNRARCLQIRCAFTQSNLSEEEDEAGNGRAQSQQHVVLVERYGNGTARRFILDDEWQVQTFDADHDPTKDTRLQGSQISDTSLSWLPNVVKDFLLPAGFPGSVSDDYLGYMLLQFPTNVTGWICHAIVTSSLLKAVGIDSFSGTTAAASAAAIKWVSKDGIGAVGRLFIGGRFGNLFDDDPKQWRMYADFIGSAGSIFDLATQVYPAYFLPLASLGNLSKAVARGLKDPSFFVIQNHFAISGNLGEVAAKEEVWEVSAQLFGLALGILILDTPGLVRLYPVLSLTWLSIRLLHLWLRYQSLSVLQFNTINLKRARILVKSHVLYTSVPGCVDCNKEENILTWEKFMKPRIIFGVPLEDMVGGDTSVFKVKKLIRIYAKEKYILMVNQSAGDFEVFVSFKIGATSLSVLRSVWQVYWLHENRESFNNLFDWLSHSLLVMEDRFDDFIQQLKGAGWDTHQLNLKVPKEISIDEVGPLQ